MSAFEPAVSAWEVSGAAFVAVREKSLDTARRAFLDGGARSFRGEDLAALAEDQDHHAAV
jgi:hypothetical protein